MDQTDRTHFLAAHDAPALLHLSNICVELLVAASVGAQARVLAAALLSQLPAPVRRGAPVPEHAG